MYGSKGPWRRLLQRISRNSGTLAAGGEDLVLSVVSAVAAAFRATGCPFSDACVLATHLLQLLATPCSAAAVPSALAANGISPRSRLLLLLQLQPLICLSADRQHLFEQRRRALLPILPQCVQALEDAATAAAAPDVTLAEPQPPPESFSSLVRSDPFAVIELLLEPLQACQESDDMASHLQTTVRAAGALQPFQEGDREVEAALICTRLLLRHTAQCERLAEEKGGCCSGASGLQSNVVADWSEMCLRAVLRAPLHLLSATQIEVVFGALRDLKEVLTRLKAKVSAAEFLTEGVRTHGLLPLLAAAEAHARAEATRRAPLLEPKEVLHVVAAVSRLLHLVVASVRVAAVSLQSLRYNLCEASGSSWLATVFKRACNLKDSFSQEERAMLQTAAQLILEKSKNGGAGRVWPHIWSPPTRLTPHGCGIVPVVAGAETSWDREELQRVLKIVLRLRLFEVPPRANISWASGRSHRILAV
ncbi:uncharacterized protein LOC34620087 [Cyclospora cayetanensis]|uniref:Uncharacterized protein LOC34620087 n=1 Tax=Cyclospora cayetanensis TaxID=88456 RepID=A0A6P6RUZ5_9EIME|nr:uncharacterized protein LOC34620087 [Cyclospora cayetanensis]